MGRTRVSAEPEYRLDVTAQADAHGRPHGILITLRTTKFFSHFRYALDVNERIEDRKIVLTILGLRAPHLDLPAAGPAEFRHICEHLDGDYTIVIEGPDGSASEALVRIAPHSVTLLRPMTGTFVAADIPRAHPET